jgi:hypothetical protein
VHFARECIVDQDVLLSATYDVVLVVEEVQNWFAKLYTCFGILLSRLFLFLGRFRFDFCEIIH